MSDIVVVHLTVLSYERISVIFANIYTFVSGCVRVCCVCVCVCDCGNVTINSRTSHTGQTIILRVYYANVIIYICYVMQLYVYVCMCVYVWVSVCDCLGVLMSAVPYQMTATHITEWQHEMHFMSFQLQISHSYNDFNISHTYIFILVCSYACMYLYLLLHKWMHVYVWA